MLTLPGFWGINSSNFPFSVLNTLIIFQYKYTKNMKKQSLFITMILTMVLMTSNVFDQEGPQGYFEVDFSEDLQEAKFSG